MFVAEVGDAVYIYILACKVRASAERADHLYSWVLIDIAFEFRLKHGVIKASVFGNLDKFDKRALSLSPGQNIRVVFEF